MNNIYRRFLADKGANFATIFGITLVPLMAATGMAVEYSRASNAHSQLQNAADTAALAGASLKSSSVISDDDLKAFTNEYAAIQVDPLNQIKRYNFTTSILDDGQIHVRGNAAVENMMFSFMGAENSNLVVDAVASYQTPTTAPPLDTEIVLAVDMTNSMNFGTTWEDAKRILADTMVALEKRADVGDFYGALVPFSDRVNVGETKNRQHWLTTSKIPKDWNGCVEPREKTINGHKYAVDAERPENSFNPSHPGHYIATGMNSLGTGDAQCPSPIAEPTKDVAALSTAINALNAKSGTGRFDEGLAWSWRMLSKSWRGKWGQPAYPGEHGTTHKQIVFISDGRTTINRREYAQKEPWGWNMGDDVVFNHMTDLCARIKKDQITLSIIQLAGNDKATPYMKMCASPDNYFYVQSAGDFTGAIQEITDNFEQAVILTK